MSLRPTLFLLALVAACGGSGDAPNADDSAAADTSASAPVAAAPAAPGGTSDAPLGADDVERWAKGMEGEKQALYRAEDQLKAATSGTDTLSALGAAGESATRAAGAQAAGLSEERYARVRDRLGELATAMVPSAMETNGQMPAEMVAQMKAGREEGLAKLVAETPPEVVEALRPRAQALADLNLSLAGERMRIATGRPRR